MKMCDKMVQSNGINTNNQSTIVQPLLTDMYQITMAYVYWKCGKIKDHAVFDLFFRKNPFQGEFTIFAGLEECLKFIEKFKFSVSDIEYLKGTLPADTDEEFFDYLLNLDVDKLLIYAIDEGSIVFPKIPLLRVEGPLILVQLLETTLLTLVNYASLMTTNAARYRLAAGADKQLLEFGLRRAQGPDGGLSASKYAFIGGFDATSNVLAGKMFGIPVAGTHAHSFVTSFSNTEELKVKNLKHADLNRYFDFVEITNKWLERLVEISGVSIASNNGELASFISYAISFPQEFVALVDTYDVRKSGLPNFCAVSLALNELGYKTIGIRIDSGDLAYLSQYSYNFFSNISEKYNLPWFKDILILVSNDINEETILSLNDQRHNIKGFGIGTHLVTCQRQPALGCVYKMVEVNNCPRMKISQEFEKMTMPGKKNAYRLYGAQGYALIDLMQMGDEPDPVVGQKVLCRHPFDTSKRCYVIPQKVEKLHKLYWKNGTRSVQMPTLEQIRKRVQDSLQMLRSDIKRTLNPTPYKIAVSENMFNFIRTMWLETAPIGELV